MGTFDETASPSAAPKIRAITRNECAAVSQYQGEHADDLHSRVELLKDTVRIRQEARGGITIDRVAQRLHGAFEVAFR